MPKKMFWRSCLSISHISVREFNQALLPLTHTARGISDSEVSTCSQHFFLFPFRISLEPNLRSEEHISKLGEETSLLSLHT